MTIITVNAKKARYCAFCSYWFDPECRAIHPIPYAWRCDCSIQNICKKRNRRTYANYVCDKYVAKI